MARPERNTVDYFPFYCDEGKKMFYIEETYGNDGYATFVKILKELAKTEYHYLDLSNKTTLMFLSAKCKVSKDTLISIINDLSELGKFNQELWHENNIIWCDDFINSIQDAYKKRNNKPLSFEGLISLLTSKGIRKPIKVTTTSPVKPQRKEKESIEEKRKEELDARKLKFSATLSPFLEKYGSDFLNDFYKYWVEPNKSYTKFKQELERTWDIERRLDTWAKNDKNFKKTNSSGNQNQDRGSEAVNNTFGPLLK